jgi:thiol-disulfide isomerase/thioredoxin
MKSSRMIVLGALVITTAVDAIAGGQVQVGKVSTRAPAVGDPAPPLVFDEVVWPKAGPPDLRSLDLSRLAGRVVVLEFFGTWCGPCLAFVPHMNEVIEQSADLPVTFLTIGNERRGELQATAAKYAMKSPIARDANGSIFEDYWVGGLPAVVLVDVKGRILAYTHPSQITRRNAGRRAGRSTREVRGHSADHNAEELGLPIAVRARQRTESVAVDRDDESKPRTHRAFGRPN